MVVISVYIYGVKIIKKFRWESGFLCTNGSAGYLMQLSVNFKGYCRYHNEGKQVSIQVQIFLRMYMMQSGKLSLKLKK